MSFGVRCLLFAVMVYLRVACRFSVVVDCGLLRVDCCLLRVGRWSVMLAWCCLIVACSLLLVVFVCVLLVAG